jgi:hypothetical protein
MFMKKRSLSFLLAFALTVSLILAFTAGASASEEIRVSINGEYVIFPDQRPVIVDSRTLVPVRGVFEHLGFEVEWDEEEWAAVIFRGDLRLVIPVGSDTFTVNGEARFLDVPAQLINARTMLPIRLPLEAAGYEVDWCGETWTVIVTSPEPEPEPEPEHPAHIYIRGRGISTAQTVLNLSSWELTDEEIEPLRYMVNLTDLQLWNNNISDISPLAGLINLERLCLDRNQISDITPLAGLTNLIRLDLGENKISDISIRFN